MVNPAALISPLVASPRDVNGAGFGKFALSFTNATDQGFFGPANEPPSLYPESPKVRIWVGLQKVKAGTPGKPGEFPEPDQSMGGDNPWITLYDDYGAILSDEWYSKPMHPGGYYDFDVGGDRVRDPTYISISMPDRKHKDGVCIAAVQMKNGDDPMRASAFFGDIPRVCGWPVYASATKIWMKDGSTYEPWCFWLDYDNTGFPPLYKDEVWQVTNNHSPISVNFHVRDFMVNQVTLDAYKEDRDLVCKAGPRIQAHNLMPRTFAIYTPPLIYDGDNANNYLPSTKDQPGMKWNQSYDDRRMPGRLRARDAADGDEDDDAEVDDTPREPPDFTLDIMTTGKTGNSSFSADLICGTENAMGPSFVNVQEGKYCDMESRRVLPVCSDSISHDCLLIEEDEKGEESFKVIGPAPVVAAGSSVNLMALPKTVAKTYQRVTRMRDVYE